MKKNRRPFAPLVYLRNAMHPDPRGHGLFSWIMITYYFGSAATSFVAAYLTERGLSGTQVGTAMAVINLFGILSAPVCGSISDRIRSPRRVMMACLAAASVVYLCVGLFGTVAVAGMPLFLVLLPLWSVFKTPLSSLLDSFTVQTVNRRRTFTYGSVRCLGSLGFSVMSLIFGQLIGFFGSNRCVFFLYGALNAVAFAFLHAARGEDLPREKGEHGVRVKQAGGVKMALSSFYFRFFLITYLLVCVPVQCLTTFLPYKLTAVTGSTAAFGTLIALKAFTEIPSLLLGGRIIERFGVRRMLTIAMLVFTLEQTLYLCADSLVLVMIALLLHGATYGMFLSCAISYIYIVTPYEANASAQTVACALASGATILGSLAGGVLVDVFGANGYYGFTLCLEILAIVLFLISVPIGRRRGHGLPGVQEAAR